MLEYNFKNHYIKILKDKFRYINKIINYMSKQNV